jgi:hypothetical protein
MGGINMKITCKNMTENMCRKHHLHKPCLKNKKQVGYGSSRISVLPKRKRKKVLTWADHKGMKLGQMSYHITFSQPTFIGSWRFPYD